MNVPKLPRCHWYNGERRLTFGAGTERTTFTITFKAKIGRLKNRGHQHWYPEDQKRARLVTGMEMQVWNHMLPERMTTKTTSDSPHAWDYMPLLRVDLKKLLTTVFAIHDGLFLEKDRPQVGLSVATVRCRSLENGAIGMDRSAFIRFATTM